MQGIVQKLRKRWVAFGVGSIALLSMMTAFALVPSGNTNPPNMQVVLEELSTPSLIVLDSGVNTSMREERIQHLDTLTSIMERLGILDPAAIRFMQRDSTAQIIFRQLRPGKIVSATIGKSGELQSFYFPLNGTDSMIVVRRDNDGFSASEEVREFEHRIVVKSGEIRHSLFGAMDTIGVPDAITMQMAEIFSGDIDFHRDLRQGDHFSLVYEIRYYQGRPVRSGRILAAEFVNNRRFHTAYWFETEDNKSGYYSAEGKSLRKAFLRAPLAFTRISSGFSASRMHPILGFSRAHTGVDYAAPMGTPVRTVANGTVEFAGWRGGYGRLLIIRHHGPYSTFYAHLNGFAPNIRKGARVTQGQTIGFVGMTGLATGPHLHYEFRINNKPVDPRRVTLPEAVPLEASQIALFKTTIQPVQAKLELAKDIRLAQH